MRLELGYIYIKDIQFGTESKIEDGILYVSSEAASAVALEDEHIKNVSFDIARPGESVRITPVKDVIEPRVKVVYFLELFQKWIQWGQERHTH